MKFTYTVEQSTVTIGNRLNEEDYGDWDVVISVTDVPPPEAAYLSTDVYWYPWIENGTLLPLESIAACLKILHSAVQRSLNIYLHCDAGTHRSPSMFGFYLRAYHNENKEKIVRSRTPAEKEFSDPNKYADRYCKDYKLIEPLLSWIPTNQRLENSGIWPEPFTTSSISLFRYLRWLEWSKVRRDLKCILVPKIDNHNKLILGHHWGEFSIGTKWVQTRCLYCNKIRSLRNNDG